MENAINWFEIPTTNYQRAKKFYETILDATITDMPMPEGEYGMFPFDMEGGGVGGALIQSEGQQPSMTGSTIYLNGGDDLSVPLGRVEAAGGKIIFPKMGIGENGFIAHFSDTEGNRVAFHSAK